MSRQFDKSLKALYTLTLPPLRSSSMYAGAELIKQMKPLPDGGCTIYRGIAVDEIEHLNNGDKFVIAGFTSGTLTTKAALALLESDEAPVRIRVPAGIKAVYHRSEVLDEVVLEAGLLFTVTWVERRVPRLLALEASRIGD
jgi:hypothetical protein